MQVTTHTRACHPRATCWHRGARVGNIIDISEGDRRRRTRDRRQQEAGRERAGDGGAKTALVLTGGGFTGGVYQIGALRALDLLSVNSSVNDFDMVVGTSCGAFIGSLVANGARPEDMMALLDGEEVAGYEPLELDRLLRPNWRGLARSATRLPFASARIAKDVALNIRNLSLVDALAMFSDVLPGGFYSLEGMAEMLEQQLQRDGWSNDFREMQKELYIVATDLDTCEPVVFGDEGWDDVPISRATAASAALPLVYQGINIRGREFVDGGLRSFANVETAVEKGAKLVVIVNSIVPFGNDRLTQYQGARPRRVSDRGIHIVGSQMLKCLVWNALHERLEHWRAAHPDVDFILIEPRRDDELMFSTQIMNVSQRVQIARHGFESVTMQLASDFDHYRDLCAKHGIEISRRGVIEALAQDKRAESSTTRWRRILERGAELRAAR
ncbi:MAG: patatin-like phospholipase family protein [Thermoleophilia bacterium]|nr:patatin-like phospholipase family protein [Thermoleophilia bacterium]